MTMTLGACWWSCAKHWVSEHLLRHETKETDHKSAGEPRYLMRALKKTTYSFRRR